MRRALAILALALVAALPHPGARPAHAKDDKDDKAARSAAVKATQEVLRAARAKESGDKGTLSAVLEARDALKPWADDMREYYWDGPATKQAQEYATTWNELLTVAAYHGHKVKNEYVLERKAIVWKRFYIGLPVGRGWSLSYNKDADTKDQLHMYIRQRRPGGGELLREIKIWKYRWDTTYSGIGGENTKKLAKVMYELDRDCIAKTGRKTSNGVKARRLSGDFKRSYHYWVEGLDVDEEKQVRRQSFYIKGLYSWSYCLEVTTFRDALEDDDRVTQWQVEDDRPELDAVLMSFVNNPDYELPK